MCLCVCNPLGITSMCLQAGDREDSSIHVHVPLQPHLQRTCLFHYWRVSVDQGFTVPYSGAFFTGQNFCKIMTSCIQKFPLKFSGVRQLSSCSSLKILQCPTCRRTARMHVSFTAVQLCMYHMHILRVKFSWILLNREKCESYFL